MLVVFNFKQWYHDVDKIILGVAVIVKCDILKVHDSFLILFVLWLFAIDSLRNSCRWSLNRTSESRTQKEK